MGDHDLPAQLVNDLNESNEINSIQYAQKKEIDHQKIVGAIKSLESLGDVISVGSQSIKCWHCTEEGVLISKEGSHEARLVSWLPKEGATVDDVKQKFPNANVALGAALKNKWVHKNGATIVPVEANITDQVQADLQNVVRGKHECLTPKQLQDYRKRKLVKDSDVTVFTVSKGPQFTTNVTKQEAELTKEMIESGQWKNKTFKPFNFRAKGKQDTRPGYLHPLMQLRSEFRQIFLEMGFSEMPTNHFVESAFWNFDALFQPQQHPARDAHDTFYIKDPPRALSVPKDYMERVCTVHSKGGYGSSGYRYPWSVEEAHKNLLRTHTTAVSARMLHKLAQDGFRPSKYFSIDRVFRNETLDATHLAEFHQIEGVVADYNLGVKHLMGVITAFFEKIGIKKLRFKAAYNPYTEPSMEIFSYHAGLKKWVEIGNSGVFRPEMLRPMGLPEDVTVLGFGLSLERPAMIMFGSNNIRELVGPRVKMEHIYNNPLCSVDKFQGSSLPPPPFRAPFLTPRGSNSPIEKIAERQHKILSNLEKLQGRVLKLADNMSVKLRPSNDSSTASMAGNKNALAALTGCPCTTSCTEIVVTADPRRVPHCIVPLVVLLSRTVPTEVVVHCHSSVGEVPPSVKNVLKDVGQLTDTNSVPMIRIRFIWTIAPPGKSSDTAATPPLPLRQMSRNKSVGVVCSAPVQPPRLIVSPLDTTSIAGENNICRYMARLVELLSVMVPTDNSLTHPVLYEGLSECLVSEADAWIDDCQAWLITGSNRGRANFLNKLSNKLGASDDEYILGQSLTVADIFVASSLTVLGRGSKMAQNVIQWSKKCQAMWIS